MSTPSSGNGDGRPRVHLGGATDVAAPTSRVPRIRSWRRLEVLHHRAIAWGMPRHPGPPVDRSGSRGDSSVLWVLGAGEAQEIVGSGEGTRRGYERVAARPWENARPRVQWRPAWFGRERTFSCSLSAPRGRQEERATGGGRKAACFRVGGQRVQARSDDGLPDA